MDHYVIQGTDTVFVEAVHAFTTAELAGDYAKYSNGGHVYRVISTEEDISALDKQQLLALFNNAARQEVARFSSREAGVKRTRLALEGIDANDFLPATWAERKAKAEAPQPKQPEAVETVKDVKPKNVKRPSLADAIAKPKTEKTKPVQQQLPGIPAPVRNREKGINLKPKDKVYPAREGSKQARLIELLSGPCGATMSMLKAAMDAFGKPWTEASVKTGLNWDVHSLKGYGIRTEFKNGEGMWELCHYDDADALGFVTTNCGHPDERDAEGVEASRKAPGYDANAVKAVYFLTYPKGVSAPLGHNPIKSKKPEAAPAK